MTDKEVENVKKQAVLDLLEVVPLQTLRIALLYARNYAEYGEDVTKTWATATEQSAALEGARNRGYYDGLKSADAFKVKSEVLISQLRADRDRLATALEEIKAELHGTAEMHDDGDYYLREEWIDEVFDKHQVEEGGKDEMPEM